MTGQRLGVITCPTGCGRRVKRGHLMCGPCWGAVPRELQRDVYRTFRAWRSCPGDPDRFLAYEQAREAAIASIE